MGRPLSIYPCEAKVGGSVWPRANVRANSAGNRIQVWVESNDFPKRPVCVIDSPIEATLDNYNQYAPLSQRYGSWMIANNMLLEVQGAGGCGCGSPLQQLPQWSADSQQMYTRAPIVTKVTA